MLWRRCFSNGRFPCSSTIFGGFNFNSSLVTTTGYRPHISTVLARTITNMAAKTDLEIKWPAAKVRDTFLDYFKQNGHTFGMISLSLPSYSGNLIGDSPLFVRGATLGSYAAVHQCWNESVQVDFPWNRGSPVRFCTAQARCEFPKG